MATLLLGTTIGGYAAIHAGNIGAQSVNYASSAGSVTWSNVSGRPTLLSQFTNDLGNYGSWITASYLDDYTRGDYRVISDYGGNTTWYLRSGGQFIWGRSHDWSYSFRLNLPSGSQNNGTWAYIGQQDSNATSGTWRGLRVRKHENGSVDGDLSAGAFYIGDTRKDQNWDTAYGWGNHASQGYATELYVNTAIANHNHNGVYLPLGGSWSADLGSYGFTRQAGYTATGGEWVLLTNNSQVSTLIDGSYFAGENGGFYSMASSNTYASRKGFYNDGTYANFNTAIYVTGDIVNSSAIYPGFNNGASNAQTSYYLYGNTSNSGIRTNGNFLVNSDIYLGTRGQWLSTYLNQNVRTDSSPTFSSVYFGGSQLTTSMVNGLSNMLGVTTLPYSCDITVDGDPDKFYAVQFWGGDQDVWRRIIIKRGYSEPAPWDPIGTGAHHGGLLLDWEGNFGGWGGAEYADRLRVFNESYTNVCADMFLYSHAMGYIFMLRGGGAVYHLFSDQAINGFYQSGSPDILYSSSTLSYDDAWSGTNQYDVYAPTPLGLGQVNSSRIDGLRTKKQSLLDGRYLIQGVDISGISNITASNNISSLNFLATNAYYLNGTSYFLNSTNGGIYTNARFESASTIYASGGNSSQWNTAYGWGNHASAGYVPSGRTITINGTAYDLSANRSWTISASDSTKLPLAGGTMSGTIVLASISGTDQMVENTYGAYLHLGGWGIGRTDAAAVLVNTAYRADYADSLFDMNISRFTNNSGYITSSGSISGNAATTSQRTFDYIYATSYLESAGAVYGTVFYDNNDRNYYVDPNGMSKQVQLTNLGTYGSNAANARNHFVQYNAGNAGIAGGWIAAAFGDATAARVVIGQAGSITEAIIGSHNGNLTDWGALGYVATTHKFYAPSWTSAVQLEVNTNGVYAPAYRGNANVGGTGTATWHPDGIYVGSTQWLYGTMYKNGSSIYDVGEIKMNGGPYLQTYNTRNLIVKSSDSADSGILGRGSSNQFAFQLYGAGNGDYGFLDSAWGGWDIRKTVDGAMYMNDDNSYYLYTNSESRFNTFTTAGSVVIGGTFGNNPYNAVASTRLLFGGGNEPNSYFIGTNLENYGGNYTKLDLRWHTGIRMGAQPGYGGIRFYNNETLGSRIMSIGESDANVRIDNNLWIGGAGGWITDLLNAKQNASTAITTSNIGNQSVSYAASAGSASNVQGYSAIDLISESRGVHSGSDFPNGTLVRTDIYANGWAGDSFVMEVSGKSYDSSNTPFKLVMQGYLYADTIINVSAMSYGSYFPGPVRVMNLDGNIAFWWPRGSYWNSFEVHVREAGGIGWNRAQSIENSDMPSQATKVIAINPVQVVHSNNIGSQSVNYASSAGNADTVDGYHMNQNVLTSSGPTFQDVYVNGWFRNNNQNQGLYNQSSGNHFYSKAGGVWAITGAGSGVELQFRSNHESTIRGYVYGDTSSNFGLLNDQGGWSVRCYSGSSYGGALSGTWTASGDLVAYSDARVKTDIATIDNALEKVLQLRGVTYVRTDGDDHSQKIGVIAQEVREVLPQVVHEQTDGMLGVSYGNIVGVLIEAIKEQQKEIEELKAKLN